MPSTCTEKCWTPVPCPAHGDRMQPRGRDAGIEHYNCCGNYAANDMNPCHLWSIHDSTRWYTDPQGWNEHEANCPECGPEEDE